MNETDLLRSTPIGSIASLDDLERERYAILAVSTPPSLQDLIFSARTGAYISGLLKSHNIAEDKATTIAFIVLRISVGEIHLSKLAATISSELGSASDVSEKMAREIEHDLFAPVAGDLSQYLASRKKENETMENKATGNPRAAGATNVLDLKQEKPLVPPPRPQPPKPLPPRPPVLPPRRIGNKPLI